MNKRYLHLLLCLLIALLIIGCSGDSQEYFIEFQTSWRDSPWVNGLLLTELYILIDGKVVGTVPQFNCSEFFFVKGGKHTIEVRDEVRDGDLYAKKTIQVNSDIVVCFTSDGTLETLWD